MTARESHLDPAQIQRVRALLQPPRPRQSVWHALAAAALLAVTALAFATAMIVAPANVSEHVAPERGAR